MRKGNKNIFIEGFKDPNPISSLQDILLLDIKGDGDHKLILFDRDTASLIIYKGISKDYEKAVEIKNVSHMIAFYDEDSRTRSEWVIQHSPVLLWGRRMRFISSGISRRVLG